MATIQTEPKRRRSISSSPGPRGRPPKSSSSSSSSTTSSSIKNDNEMVTYGSGGLISNRSLGSLLLMIVTPIAVLCFWYCCYAMDGSIITFGKQLLNIELTQKSKGYGFTFLWNILPTPFNPLAWKIILSYIGFELFLMKYVPGKEFKATVTPSGHVPIYNANGVECYLISIATLFLLKFSGNPDLNPAIVYDNMGYLLSAVNVFALLLCAFLTFKGLNFPSTKDCGSSGDWIVDFFWGTELYPRILGFDVKQFTNCRFGMMFWQLGIICYAMKQYDTLGYVSSSMLVSVVVQTVYVFKFFLWETGYFCTMDIQHDRAGYYICWGCLMWVPSMYTIHTYFLTAHPYLLSVPLAFSFMIVGVFCVWVNYDCDRQRQEFRQTNGKAKVWGEDPVFIVAEYTTKDGETRNSLLLCSGWWGLARHFHYIPEIVASFFWCVPALFGHALPYFYPVYLTILLFDRAWRDEARCADKYRKNWKEYTTKVPYKIIPGIV